MHLVGLAVDAEGRIVVASIEGGLVRFLPDGGEDAEFDQPLGWPD
jgi:sugar lactone lactonase YvrE